MLPALKSLGRAEQIRKIVTAGAGQSREGDDEEFALLMELDLIDGFEQRGPLPEEKNFSTAFAGRVWSFGAG